MPVQKSKRRTTIRRRSVRGANGVDPLRHKLHDLANSLEAISLARQFVPRDPRSIRLLDAIESGLGDARKVLRQIDTELRGHERARRQGVGR